MFANSYKVKIIVGGSYVQKMLFNFEFNTYIHDPETSG